MSNIGALTAMKQAREALEVCYGRSGLADMKRDRAIAALDAAITQAERAQPVATVTECEACFTPDVCQLRGTCDHYSAERLRVAAAQAERAEPLVRGTTGVCSRSACECEASGLGKQCVWLRPSDEELERRTGEPHIDGWPLYSGLPPPPKITEDDLRAMLPESTVEKRYFSAVGNLLAYPVWTEQQMLAYGRAIAQRCGGMK